MAPKTQALRSDDMIGTLEDLQRRMATAAAALNFEEARRLRDQINLSRGASVSKAANADTSGLQRQRAGAMGSGQIDSALFRRLAGNRRQNRF